VTITPESDVLHHDEGPVSVITTAALRRTADVHGAPVDAARFRANLLVDTEAAVGYPEDNWLGRPLHVGPDLVLRPERPLARWVMINLPQDALPGDGRLLHTISTHRAMAFGVWATVIRPGRIRLGDTVAPAPA
jgi:uncharacterized protein YcbX